MIDSLTSLRFIFALMIFLTHCYMIDDVFSLSVIQEGYVGVSFFFVLSGFIISYNYRRKLQEGAISRRAFWAARVARVYPLHWLTLLMAALCGLHAAPGAMAWLRHFLASLTLTNAYVPLSGYFFAFNSPAWSLCCEQLFYLCFPLLVPLAANGRRLLLTLCAVSVPLVAGMHFTPEEFAKGCWYVNPIARFPDFMVGMLLFHLYERLKRKSLSVRRATLMEAASVALFLVFYLCAPRVPQVYRYSCYYWLPVAAVLAAFSLQRGVLSRALSCRPLILGGEISYSFYLLHFLVLRGYTAWQAAAGFRLAWYISVPLLFCFTVLLSLLSYRCFERPMNRRLKLWLNR